MKKSVVYLLCAALMLTLLAGCATTPPPAPAPDPAPSADAPPAAPEPPAAPTPEPPKPVTLNFTTGGDTNMVEFFKNLIAPAFTEKYPWITVNVISTGVGDDGSRNYHTKLKAQLDAGKETWDIDAACVNQSVMRDLIADGLITKYVPEIENAKYVNTPSSKNALGTNIEDYVVPLFQSQVVLAYNSEKVPNPPKSFAELEEWIKANPKKFGYNGVTGGMSGVGFTAGWLYYKTGKYDLISKGPYSEEESASWAPIMKELKSLPCIITQGNAGTLDMLNRGEIEIGPVWVDMLLLWKSDGRMSPAVKMLLPEPGMPGQPMHMVVSAKAANREAAVLWCNFLADPKIQAQYQVEKYTWHPGVDATAVFAECSQAAKDLLFAEVTAEEIAKKGLSLPITPYQSDMIRVYTETR